MNLEKGWPFIRLESGFDIGSDKTVVEIILGRVSVFQKHIILKTEDNKGTVTDATIAEALRKLADSINPPN